jgi:hypothetical protein
MPAESLPDSIIEDIETKARAATSGPWTAHTPAWRTGFVHGAHSYEVASGLHHYDARYIASLSPDVVLSLLSEIRRLRGVLRIVDRVRENYDESIFGAPVRDGPVDRYSAAGARIACDEIASQIREGGGS